jgi:hypothetical protein
MMDGKRKMYKYITLIIHIVGIALLAQEFVEINVNGEVFTKPYPQTYEESVKMIESLVSVVDKMNNTMVTIDSLNDSLDSDIREKLIVVKTYGDSIQVINRGIDSLKREIVVLSTTLRDTVDALTDTLQEDIDDIIPIDGLNVGIQAEFSKGFTADEYIAAVRPLLIYKRLLIGIGAGASVRDSSFIPHWSVSVGFKLE